MVSYLFFGSSLLLSLTLPQCFPSVLLESPASPFTLLLFPKIPSLPISVPPPISCLSAHWPLAFLLTGDAYKRLHRTHMSILPARMSVHCWCLRRPEKVVGSSGTAVTLKLCVKKKKILSLVLCETKPLIILGNSNSGSVSRPVCTPTCIVENCGFPW